MSMAPEPEILRVTFAPDWSRSVPYQSQLADALSNHRVEVDYLRHYRRGLPLWRGLRDLDLDLFHLHWPEKFWQIGEHFKTLRHLRYPIDLYLASRRHPLLLTAHNLLPHTSGREFLQKRNARAGFRRARRVFVHSRRAGELVSEAFGVPARKIVRIPFGDLSPPLGDPKPRVLARRGLGLDPEEPVALIFGAIRDYKGIREVLEWWRDRPGLPHLHVVGWGSADDSADACAATLQDLARGQGNITVRVTPWLPEPELNAWLSAADVVVCNHLRAFSSGGACLARSRGVPLLMPASAEAVDLGEPDPRVRRFDRVDEDFGRALEEMLAAGADHAAAAPWRETTSWDRVAGITAATYREVFAEAAAQRG